MSRGTVDVESHEVDIVGAAEAAKMLDCPSSSITRWVREGRFPTPIKVLRATPVWRTRDIEEFAAVRRQREQATAARREREVAARAARTTKRDAKAAA